MRQKYIKDIFKVLSAVTDTWILEQIYRFAVNMTKGGADNG